jgi:acetylornithine deacetylase/succinyl-diaminopimelate desuccinylase-like protein
VSTKFPWVDGTRPVVANPTEQLLARTWRPALTVTGADGLPATAMAGNVLRPSTTLQLSMRLPPTCRPEVAMAAVRTALVTDPPYGARVSFTPDTPGPGWNAPAFAPWLWASLERASQATFGRPARTYGEGGSIPFMGMLGELFPEAQFVITGVLGPDSNAHGPDEYLHLPTAERLTVCLAAVLDEHAGRHRS